MVSKLIGKGKLWH